MAVSDDDAACVLKRFDDRLDQYRRIVREFPEDRLWVRPQADMVSLGNLVCHIAGAMRDWFENGIAQGNWKRDRQSEFDRDGGFDREGLIAHLDETRARCDSILNGIIATNWHETRPFRNETFQVRDMLLRQLEHVHYHAGQAAFLRRIVAKLEPAT